MSSAQPTPLLWRRHAGPPRELVVGKGASDPSGYLCYSTQTARHGLVGRGMAWANGHGHRTARQGQRPGQRRDARPARRGRPRPGGGPRAHRTGSASIVRPPLLALLIFAFLDFVVSRYICYIQTGPRGAGAPPTPARATPGPGVAGPSSDLRPSSPVPSRAAPGRARRPPRLSGWAADPRPAARNTRSNLYSRQGSRRVPDLASTICRGGPCIAHTGSYISNVSPAYRMILEVRASRYCDVADKLVRVHALSDAEKPCSLLRC